MVGGKIFSNLKELPQSVVLAVSPTTVYVLGRDTLGCRRSLGHAPADDQVRPRFLERRVKQTLATLDITLVDTEHDATLELEAKRLGTLDVKALLELLMLSDEHIDSSVDEENARTE